MESNGEAAFSRTHVDIVALDNSELSDLDQMFERISNFVKSVDGIDIIGILDEVLRLNFVSCSGWLSVGQEVDNFVFPRAWSYRNAGVWILSWNRVDFTSSDMSSVKECLLRWWPSVPISPILNSANLSPSDPNRVQGPFLPSREKT